jgi:hypothetical protein
VKLRITVESPTPTRVVVSYEPSWLARLLGHRPWERFADCYGWAQEWRWSVGDRLVPEHVEQAIALAQHRTGPVYTAAVDAAATNTNTNTN